MPPADRSPAQIQAPGGAVGTAAAVPRVCMVVESYAPVVGGMERQAEMLVDGLVEAGVPCEVLTLLNAPGLRPYEDADGYSIRRVAEGRTRWTAIPPVYRTLRDMKDMFDLAYVCGFRTLGIPAVAAGRRFGKTVVLRADNDGELSGAYFDGGLARFGTDHTSPPFSWANRVRKRWLLTADHFVAIASHLKAEFLEHGVPESRISTIPNSVDLDTFRPATSLERARIREELKLPADRPILCFSGRLVRRKGALLLLEAWRRFLERDEASTASSTAPLLLMLGGGGVSRDDCEEEARRFCEGAGLSSRVRFEGDVDNVQDYLRASDAFALPTLEESFGLAVLEAMACGLPVLTTRVGGHVSSEPRCLSSERR